MVWTGTNLMLRILFRFLCLINEMFLRASFRARASDLTWHDERAHKVFSSLFYVRVLVFAHAKRNSTNETKILTSLRYADHGNPREEKQRRRAVAEIYRRGRFVRLGRDFARDSRGDFVRSQSGFVSPKFAGDKREEEEEQQEEGLVLFDRDVSRTV
jgi:hypothetical protein